MCEQCEAYRRYYENAVEQMKKTTHVYVADKLKLELEAMDELAERLMAAGLKDGERLTRLLQILKRDIERL